jgi:hypothetical protein
VRMQRDSLKEACSNPHVDDIKLCRRRNDMSLSSHLNQLKKKHEHLSFEVEQAERSPAIDRMHVKSLKKEKLRLKDEIERLSPV